MSTRILYRALAACLIAAVFAMAPTTAQARHWHGGGFGGFRGGFYGGGFRGGYYAGYGRGFYGGYGRGFYGGYYPRFYAGFYPRYYGGFYGGYPGYYGGFYPAYYGGNSPACCSNISYGYPRYATPVNYGYGYGCSANGIYGYSSTVAAAPARVSVVNAARIAATTNALPAESASRFQYYLANNPYRRQAAKPLPTVLAGALKQAPPLLQAGYENPYRSGKVIEPPPAPGL